MKVVQVKKGEILQHKGELKPKQYKVKHGLLRSYSLDDKGKEHTFLFAPEGWIVSDNIITTEPTELFIDALENSVVEVYENLDKEQKPESSLLFKRIFVLQKRVIMLLSASAIDRYDYFLEVYPEISRRVPQKMIASYLGITPEALSKVKNLRK